jgi:hypothetical protein
LELFWRTGVRAEVELFFGQIKYFLLQGAIEGYQSTINVARREAFFACPDATRRQNNHNIVGLWCANKTQLYCPTIHHQKERVMRVEC